jgi:superfamily II DNA/RNA helicase
LFDFPRNTIDYIHRVGRAGRAVRQGKVTSFVGKKDKELAEEIKV